jgi:hypothetical protein
VDDETEVNRLLRALGLELPDVENDADADNLLPPIEDDELGESAPRSLRRPSLNDYDEDSDDDF